MSNLKLYIGNKKYSSWSMRPWIALRHHGIDFDEELTLFDHANDNAHFWKFSPTRKVPVLVHDDLTVWDSLAILEYVAELFPETQLWPDNRAVRAHALTDCWILSNAYSRERISDPLDRFGALGCLPPKRRK